jgi:hypothetical protein
VAASGVFFTSVTPAVRGFALTLLLLVLAGCSLMGGDDASIDVAELERLVLQPPDLPRSYLRFDEGRQIAAEAPEGARADPTRFGRRDGWKARYRGPGGTPVIESKADLFDSAAGAEDELEAARADLDQSDVDWSPIGEPGLGDQSFAATYLQGTKSSGVRFYQVVWREDKVTASLLVNGFARRLSLADVLELAQAQQRRVADAAQS